MNNDAKQRTASDNRMSVMKHEILKKQTAYQELVGNVMTILPAMFDHASPASLVAQVIYEAATDGSDQMRYIAGEDAKALIADRDQSGAQLLFANMKTQFGL